MPGLAQRNEQYSNAFWSKHNDDVSYNQLQKFWSELSLQARQELLRIDKQALFERARKNIYCSRCNGLLLEGFLQIVMYGKSLQLEGVAGNLHHNRSRVPKNGIDDGLSLTNGTQEEIQDPSVHPWGGLTTTRDGSLTLLDCYLCPKSLRGLQKVFDSSRARERERELLYPDACGGEGRGWISQGIASYGRFHGARETCALHTARLSCDTLVDFWSALGEETRRSLLRMKEEDFIERLMYRFDSKRFCRDCRRNVIREFKELKELKRMRREPRCTSWFCVADTTFLYEVSDDTVKADWHQTFADTIGTYHHFEWAVGTGEGKSDIMEFENVGMSGSVRVSGLDLDGLSSCYITLRAWKLDGRCSEISVKAHALKGQQCVHCRLVVGDGYVTITRGENIRRFFEHAEEADEEEDDDSMDKDGNDVDGECFRPQKHAKSPELAREFLLDAATVIFKEQVEKAFREGTARQNAHSIFVCLAIKLLEERVHVACKEIITLEKQMKLLEEEEKEKREEEEQKERKRKKEREKKLRRKERLKGKEREKEKKCAESSIAPAAPDLSKELSSTNIEVEENIAIDCSDSVSETGDMIVCTQDSIDNLGERFLDEDSTTSLQSHSFGSPDGEDAKVKDGNGSFTMERSKFSRRRLKFCKDGQFDTSVKWSDRRRFAVSESSPVNRCEARYRSENFEVPSRSTNGLNRQSRISSAKSSSRNSDVKYAEKFQCPNSRSERYEFCSCGQHNEYRTKIEPYVSATREGRELKSVSKSNSALDVSKQVYRGNKYNQQEYIHEECGRLKNKIIAGNNLSGRDSLLSKKVWEPAEAQRNYPRSNSDTDVTLRSSSYNEGAGADHNFVKSSGETCSSEASLNLGEINHEHSKVNKSSTLATDEDCYVETQDKCSSRDAASKEVGVCANNRNPTLNGNSHSTMSSTSSSDNCSSCLSEGDSNTSSSNHGNLESSSSDSEEISQQSDGKDTSISIQNGFSEHQVKGIDSIQHANGGVALESQPLFGHSPNGRDSSVCIQNGFTKCRAKGIDKSQDVNIGVALESQASFAQTPDGGGNKVSGNPPTTVEIPDNEKSTAIMGSQDQGMFPSVHNQTIQFPVYQAPSTMSYYHHNPVPWPATPANGLMPFPPPNPYFYTDPIGYGLNGNSGLCMSYGTLQHFGNHLLNPSTVPVYQPVSKVNGLYAEDHIQVLKSVTAKEEAFTGVNTGRVTSGRLHTIEQAANGEGRRNDVSSKSHRDDTNFSLFHFGGPVALSTACKSNPTPLKEEIAGELSYQFSASQVENDHACNKKETSMEEYSLFAASNSIRFSFF
ncbi:uncharacterized protein LOC120153886 [Hibiscus syriacus]|uniref:uncharacterized protein LOC120153886 n=1 Tax=Hibiscus syriacus TaxID=106335 RepID=UPI001923EC57|nr:uncharacterized protein LOC120153886 [Hibiscus syriacus]